MNTIYQREHFVQFYQDDELLVENLKSFVGAGLLEGDICLVIATPEHRSAMEQLLIKKGIDIAEATRLGRYLALDAQETLNSFMVDDLPSGERFHRIFGGILKQFGTEGRMIRGFGEMVALLWAQDNQEGAVLLEQLWNDIAQHYKLTLFCAYPMHHFENEGHVDMLHSLSKLHSSAITPLSQLT